MLKVNDKVKIWCEPWPDSVEFGTVISVDEMSYEDHGFTPSPDCNVDLAETLIVVILKMDDDSIRSLVAMELSNPNDDTCSPIDWQFPSKAPWDVKVEVVER